MAKADQSPTERPIRVMLVDDDHKLRDLCRRMLEDDGFEVALDVPSGEAAAKAVDATDPDVVVIDYTLPDYDGLRLADAIRAARPEQPVVIFSSLFDLSLRRQTESRGYQYIEKVEGIDGLEGSIRAALDQGSSADDA